MIAPCIFLVLALHLAQSSSGSRIAVLTVTDHNLQYKYRANIATMECLASMHGYTFMNLTGDEYDTECGWHSNFFFRKHCTVYQHMLLHTETEWFAVLDGDINIINPQNHRLETYLHSHHADLVLSLRFHSNEVMSGLYLVRNTKWGRGFVQQWAQLDPARSDFSGTNADNGALHYLLLTQLTDENIIVDEINNINVPNQRRQECVEIATRKGAINSDLVNCMHWALHESGCVHSGWQHVKVLRHNETFLRDFWYTDSKWSINTFMLHDLKNHFRNDQVLGCPPHPIPDKHKHFTSPYIVDAMMDNVAATWTERRRQHGYIENSCIFDPRPKY